LTGLLGAFRAFSYGSLYPALRRMQLDALIAEDAAPEGTPVRRRGRRVYRLTDAGRQRFAELVADTGPQNYTDDGFGVHLAFFNRTPAEARMRILEGRRRQVEERREGLRERNGGKACVKRWRGPAAHSIATPASFTSSGWSPASAK